MVIPVNPPSPHTHQDWTQSTVFRLPTGLAWNTDPNSGYQQTLACFSNAFQQVEVVAGELMVDAFPASTVQLSPEWQDTLGLPGPCTVSYDSDAQAQAAIVAQLGDRGGCSLQYFTNLCTGLGYYVRVMEFKPAQVGDPVGVPLYPDDSIFRILFQVIECPAGYTEADLACELWRRCPTHMMFHIQQIDGTMLNPPAPLYPQVTGHVTNGVATFSFNVPMIGQSSVQYMAGTYSGTVTFAPWVQAQSVTLSNTVSTVTLSNPVYLTL